jgi:spore maturation protein CgeB
MKLRQILFGLLPSLKATLVAFVRRYPWIYEFTLRRRGEEQERDYLLMTRQYNHAPDSSFEVILARSKDNLSKKWKPAREKKNAPADVNILTAYLCSDFTDPIIPELSSSFNITHFELEPYYRDLVRPEESSRARGRFQTIISEFIHDAHSSRTLDLLLLYVTARELDLSTIRNIRKLGVPIAIISLDDKHTFKDGSIGGIYSQKMLIPEVDVFLSNSQQAVHWYVAEGGSAYYYPQGADPNIFKKINVPKDIDVSFIGQGYGYRFGFIDKLRNHGIDVKCFGKNWGSDVISHQDKVQIYNRSKINLGIGWTGLSNKMTCLKGRDFEIPMTGNVYLTNFDFELANCYSVGKEILCYTNEIDCIEQIVFVLNNENRMDEIGKAARKRSLNDHTLTKRMIGFLNWMGILE